MKIRNESELLDPEQIQAIEIEKDAKYICETCIQGRNGEWVNKPAAIFRGKKAHPVSGSHYFAIVFSSTTEEMLQGTGHYAIANGQSAANEPFTGIIAENGDIIYSRYRHDFRTSEDGTATIDGGRDYTKITFNDGYEGDQVQLKIEGDRLIVLEHS